MMMCNRAKVEAKWCGEGPRRAPVGREAPGARQDLGLLEKQPQGPDYFIVTWQQRAKNTKDRVDHAQGGIRFCSDRDQTATDCCAAKAANLDQRRNWSIRVGGTFFILFFTEIHAGQH